MKKSTPTLLFVKDQSGKRESYLGKDRCKYNGKTRSDAIEDK